MDGRVDRCLERQMEETDGGIGRCGLVDRGVGGWMERGVDGQRESMGGWMDGEGKGMGGWTWRKGVVGETGEWVDGQRMDRERGGQRHGWMHRQTNG